MQFTNTAFNLLRPKAENGDSPTLEETAFSRLRPVKAETVNPSIEEVTTQIVRPDSRIQSVEPSFIEPLEIETVPVPEPEPVEPSPEPDYRTVSRPEDGYPLESAVVGTEPVGVRAVPVVVQQAPALQGTSTRRAASNASLDPALLIGAAALIVVILLRR